MPHVIIEHSANLAARIDIQSLVDVVHAAALRHGLPPMDGLRTRAAQRDHVRIANGDPLLAFVAISARIGPGRDAGAKQSFIEQLLDSAEAHVDASDHGPAPLAVAWSIELTEIDPQMRINRNHVRTFLSERSTKEGLTS